MFASIARSTLNALWILCCCFAVVHCRPSITGSKQADIDVSSTTLLKATFFNKPQKSLSHAHRHQKVKSDLIEATKDNLLYRMGLAHAPKVKPGNTSVEEMRKMLLQYRQSVQDNSGYETKISHELDDQAKIYHSYAYEGEAAPEADLSRWQNDQHPEQNLYFPVHISQPVDPLLETRLSSSKIALYKMSTKLRHLQKKELKDQFLRVEVWRIYRSPNSEGHSRVIASTKMVPLAHVGWVEFDVDTSVQTWLNDPSDNHGLEVVSYTSNMETVKPFLLPHKHVNASLDAPTDNTNSSIEEEKSDAEFDYGDKKLAPRLTIYSQEKPIVERVKRSERPSLCHQGDGETRCCRFSLEIDFHELGWSDWIVAPASYMAYFCDGDCPSDYRPANNFAALKALLHSLRPAVIPPPCCTASRYSPLSILHYDQYGQLKVTLYEDMIVEECRCG